MTDRQLYGEGSGLAIHVRRRLPGFSLDVAFMANRQRVVLFGPSGAGKSLTLQAVAGIARLDGGRIVVAGETLYDSEGGINVPPQARRVGYVPQRYALFSHLTVEQNIGYGLHRLQATERQARVREMVSLMGLGGLERRRTSELSGGQQQRVALARALAFSPRILLLDEPFSALDVPLRGELRNELLNLEEKTGIAMMIVTHDLADAFLLGQRIVVIDNGRVLQEGSQEEVFYRPATRKVAELVGIRNIFPATVIAVEGESAYLEWNQVRLEAKNSSQGLQVGQRVDVCIRPTQIMIRRPEDAAFRGRMNVLDGAIVDEVINAETYRLFVRVTHSTNRSDLEIELPGNTYFRLGLDRNKAIEMSIRPDLLHVIPAAAPSP